MPPALDDRDRQIIAERAALYDKKQGPRIGDWVDFADGGKLRISHVWEEYKEFPGRVQLTAYGSFYLSPCTISYSGALTLPVPLAEIKETSRTRYGTVWIFHHNHGGAGMGVEDEIAFRVFECALPSPRV